MILAPGEVRKLRAADVPATARVLAAAFEDNPCYAFMHPRIHTRAADLAWFFERNLRWHLSLDLTWIACLANGEIAGTVTLEPPGGVPHTALELLHQWVIPTLRRQGFRGVRRIASTDAEFRREYHGLTGGRSYWHMHAVAVAPRRQGAGIGGHMLRTVMNALDRLVHERPAPVVLSTQRERNLPLYERLGFRLQTRRIMGRADGEPGYTSWFMQHAR